MKRILIISLLAIATVSVAFGQKPTPKIDKQEQTKQDLMQLERDIGKANIDRDYAFFDRVEAEEFIFTDSGGGISNKKEDLDGLKQPPNPDVNLIAYDVEDMSVRLYEKTAVVTGKVTTRRTIKGQPNTSQSRFTDVFVWRDGRWQLVAGHSSRIRTP